MTWQSHGPNDKDNHCLWCGRKLRLFRFRKYREIKTPSDYGDYGDGKFCGLRCGYQFAIAMAGFGYRIKPDGDL